MHQDEINEYIHTSSKKISRQLAKNIDDPKVCEYIFNDVRTIINGQFMIKKLGLNDFLNYKNRKKKSKTIFIFGCGETINRLTKQQWDIISQHNTMGLSAFYMHDFIPDYHVIELPSNPNYLRLFLQIAGAKYQNVDLFIHFLHAFTARFDFKKYPNPFWVYNPFFAHIGDEKHVSIYLQNFKNGFGRNSPYLIHHNTNLNCAIGMAQAFGFEHIVLLGVDLKGAYFTQSKILSPQYPPNPLYHQHNELLVQLRIAKNLHVSPEIHPTDNQSHTASFNCLPSSQYLKIYNDIFFKDDAACTLYTGFSDSVLARFLPTYF